MPKKPHERKRPRFGDVIQIPVPGRGFAYAQYVAHHREPPGYGAMLRILPGLFKEPLTEFNDLVELNELYLVFFPLGPACNRGFVKIVDTAPVPDRFNEWPIFRGYNENYHTGKRTWFLWDGETSTRIGDLKPEHHDLSLKQTINLTELENRLASEWMPRNVT